MRDAANVLEDLIKEAELHGKKIPLGKKDHND